WDLIALEHQRARVRPAAFCMMRVVADFLEKPIRIRMVLTVGPAVLPNVRSAWNHVEGVRNDAGGQKRLTVAIEIQTPGVTGSLGKNIELLGGKAVTPNGRVEPNLADFRLREN